MSIPDGFHTITPHLLADGADAAIALFEKAFGATVLGRMPNPADPSKVLHAALQIGSSKVFISDPFDGLPRKPLPDGTGPVAFYLYFEDCDAAHDKAVAAGMTSQSAPEDMFWGDRTAVVQDEFGFVWTLATKVKDVTPEDMQAAMAAMAG